MAGHGTRHAVSIANPINTAVTLSLSRLISTSLAPAKRIGS